MDGIVQAQLVVAVNITRQKRGGEVVGRIPFAAYELEDIDRIVQA